MVASLFKKLARCEINHTLSLTYPFMLSFLSKEAAMQKSYSLSSKLRLFAEARAVHVHEAILTWFPEARTCEETVVTNKILAPDVATR
jgi:hypothetical protein